MDKGKENIIYKVDILDKEEENVKIELKQVERKEEPLLNCEKLDQNYLLETGREVLQRLRDLTLGPVKDEPHTDDTYEERDPFSGPIRRTQLPVYPEDTQRYREETTPEREHLEFETPRILAEAMNHAIDGLPDAETLKEEIQSAVSKLTDWLEEKRDSFMAPRKVDKNKPEEKS